jgi:hypothetical protein
MGNDDHHGDSFVAIYLVLLLTVATHAACSRAHSNVDVFFIPSSEDSLCSLGDSARETIVMAKGPQEQLAHCAEVCT